MINLLFCNWNFVHVVVFYTNQEQAFEREKVGTEILLYKSVFHQCLSVANILFPVVLDSETMLKNTMLSACSTENAELFLGLCIRQLIYRRAN